MIPNQTMQIMMFPGFIKIYINNLNSNQRRLLDNILADTSCEIQLEGAGEMLGYAAKGKQEKLYKLLMKLSNNFSIELA